MATSPAVGAPSPRPVAAPVALSTGVPTAVINLTGGATSGPSVARPLLSMAPPSPMLPFWFFVDELLASDSLAPVQGFDVARQSHSQGVRSVPDAVIASDLASFSAAIFNRESQASLAKMAGSLWIKSYNAAGLRAVIHAFVSPIPPSVDAEKDKAALSLILVSSRIPFFTWHAFNNLILKVDALAKAGQTIPGLSWPKVQSVFEAQFVFQLAAAAAPWSGLSPVISRSRTGVGSAPLSGVPPSVPAPGVGLLPSPGVAPPALTVSLPAQAPSALPAPLPAAACSQADVNSALLALLVKATSPVVVPESPGVLSLSAHARLLDRLDTTLCAYGFFDPCVVSLARLRKLSLLPIRSESESSVSMQKGFSIKLPSSESSVPVVRSIESFTSGFLFMAGRMSLLPSCVNDVPDRLEFLNWLLFVCLLDPVKKLNFALEFMASRASSHAWASDLDGSGASLMNLFISAGSPPQCPSKSKKRDRDDGGDSHTPGKPRVVVSRSSSPKGPTNKSPQLSNVRTLCRTREEDLPECRFNPCKYSHICPLCADDHSYRACLHVDKK